MAGKVVAVYLDDLGNIVTREQARRVRITLVGPDGTPLREIWGEVFHPGDAAPRPDQGPDYELLG